MRAARLNKEVRIMTDSGKIAHFRWWVFWTGIFNIVGYAALICPFTLKIFIATSNALGNAMGLGGTALSMPDNINHVIMFNIVGLLVVFAGIFLIVASLDIEQRAWFVFWEGLLRIFVFLLLAYFVFFSGAAQILLLFGIIDLIIGIIYLYYLFSIKDLKIT
jgi:hypothetical protein